MRYVIAALIGLYQKLIRPLMRPACRFEPSCSEYMRQAVLKYGSIRGVWLGMKRLLKCHPWHPGGHDPVP